MKPYVVCQGDYLLKLAYIHGFDADEVWNHPMNEELKKLRGDHNVLAATDVLYLPEKEEEPLPVEGGTSNGYSAAVPTVEIVLIFLDDGAPLANEPCEIEGLGDPDPSIPVGTDNDGKLTLNIPVLIRELTVNFPNKHDMTYQLSIGDMDPVLERTGVEKRLCNLGYLTRVSDGDDEEAADLLRDVLTIFQSENGIDASGDRNAPTHEALVSKAQLTTSKENLEASESQEA
jgi:N-acetylmuramoyl-L-alanine amidase